MKILGFAGSLRQASFNRALLRAAKEFAPTDVEVDIVDLDGIPLYNSDVEVRAFPEAVRALRGRIMASGAVLIATPEYMYSVSGVLKNALDWLARPPEPRALWDKPVGIMGASPGLVGTARAHLHLRQILLHERAAVLPHPQLLVPDARNKFDAGGVLIDQETRTKVTEYVDALARWAQRLA